MRTATLPLALSAALVATPVGPGAPTQAQPAGRAPERGSASGAKVDDIELVKRLMRHSVDFFEKHARDEATGSYFSEIGNDGKVVGTPPARVRHIVATGRMLHALSHASKIDAKYKDHASKLKSYMTTVMVAREGTEPYFRTAVNDDGRDVKQDGNVWRVEAPATLLVEQQAYGLCGLVAHYSIDPTGKGLEQIDEFYTAFRRRFHDGEHKGFFDQYTLPVGGKPGMHNDEKSFASSVYVGTAFLLELHDAVRRIKDAEGSDAEHKQLAAKVFDVANRDLDELADIVTDKMVGVDKTGFIVEEFDRNWVPSWRARRADSHTLSIAGHNFQAAWFLLRLSRLPGVSPERAKKHTDRAAGILRDMLAKAPTGSPPLRASPVDFENGGFHDIFRRETGEPIYHTNKAWWQQAEGVLALTLAEKLGVLREPEAIEARDKAFRFYVTKFVDPKGGEFAEVSQDGGPVSELKGFPGKSAYHTVEFYRYLIEYAGMR